MGVIEENNNFILGLLSKGIVTIDRTIHDGGGESSAIGGYVDFAEIPDKIEQFSAYGMYVDFAEIEEE